MYVFCFIQLVVFYVLQRKESKQVLVISYHI